VGCAGHPYSACAPVSPAPQQYLKDSRWGGQATPLGLCTCEPGPSAVPEGQQVGCAGHPSRPVHL